MNSYVREEISDSRQLFTAGISIGIATISLWTLLALPLLVNLEKQRKRIFLIAGGLTPQQVHTLKHKIDLINARFNRKRNHAIQINEAGVL